MPFRAFKFSDQIHLYPLQLISFIKCSNSMQIHCEKRRNHPFSFLRVVCEKCKLAQHIHFKWCSLPFFMHSQNCDHYYWIKIHFSSLSECMLWMLAAHTLAKYNYINPLKKHEADERNPKTRLTSNHHPNKKCHIFWLIAVDYS